MQSAAEVRKAFLHDAGPAHRMRGGWDEAMMTRGERPWRRPSMARRGFFFPPLWPWWSQKQEARAETHRGPGQLAEHLDLAWELLNWRRRGRTRRAKAVLGGRRMETG